MRFPYCGPPGLQGDRRSPWSRPARPGRPGGLPHGALLAFLLAGVAQAQLGGVVDIHVHADPDSVPRSIDAFDLAKLAQQKGMRALVLKSHYEPTASLAWSVRKI